MFCLSDTCWVFTLEFYRMLYSSLFLEWHFLFLGSRLLYSAVIKSSSRFSYRAISSKPELFSSSPCYSFTHTHRSMRSSLLSPQFWPMGPHTCAIGKSSCSWTTLPTSPSVSTGTLTRHTWHYSLTHSISHWPNSSVTRGRNTYPLNPTERTSPSDLTSPRYRDSTTKRDFKYGNHHCVSRRSTTSSTRD